MGLGLVILYIAQMFDDTPGDNLPNWMIPAWGVILSVIGIVIGEAGHGWHTLWVGIALLAVTAIYLGFKLVRRLVVRMPRDRPQSAPGRHSAGRRD